MEKKMSNGKVLWVPLLSLFLLILIFAFKRPLEWWVLSVLFSVCFLLISLVLRKKTQPFSLFGLVLGVIAGYFIGTAFAKLLPGWGNPLISLSTLFFGGFGSFASVGFPIVSDTPVKDDNGVGYLKLLDTSIIIDGRIPDIVDTGFLEGTLVVPKFVLQEVQALADSRDSMKRSRARRGLDILNDLKQKENLDLKISSRDYPDVHGVDAKLINLAKELNAALLTIDYNLNKVARIQGVKILNLNDLSNALKPVLQAGEELKVEILKEGKEPDQGLAYLADGTMVVVSNGVQLIGHNVRVKVASILQTSAGRIVFTEPV